MAMGDELYAQGTVMDPAVSTTVTYGSRPAVTWDGKRTLVAHISRAQAEGPHLERTAISRKNTNITRVQPEYRCYQVGSLG